MAPITTALAALAAAVAAAIGAADAAEHELKANSSTVHWGFFSKMLPPVLTVAPGDVAFVEMISHHAGDDPARMIEGDEGLESIYAWPPGDSITTGQRGQTGSGDGVHVLTGPIYVEGAEPGDVVTVEILELEPRKNPDGESFGSNAAAWWGYDFGINGPSPPPLANASMDGQIEVTTIYKFVEDAAGNPLWVEPLYQFQYGLEPIQTSPCIAAENFAPGVQVPCENGTQTWDGYWFPGLLSKHPTSADDWSVNSSRFKIPYNPHVGCMGLSPSAVDVIDSIPPRPTGGNLDNRRIGVGAKMYYPVEVAGALLSMGDAHLAQGDSELDGTGVEASVNGRFKIDLLKASELPPMLQNLTFPLLENVNEWVVHGFTFTDFIAELGYDQPDGPDDIVYFKSDINMAMSNTYVNARDMLMRMGYSESEVRTMLTAGADFGITQVVDGNWGTHCVLPKWVLNPTSSAYSASNMCGTSVPLSNASAFQKSP